MGLRLDGLSAGLTPLLSAVFERLLAALEVGTADFEFVVFFGGLLAGLSTLAGVSGRSMRLEP